MWCPRICTSSCCMFLLIYVLTRDECKLVIVKTSCFVHFFIKHLKFSIQFSNLLDLVCHLKLVLCRYYLGHVSDNGVKKWNIRKYINTQLIFSLHLIRKSMNLQFRGLNHRNTHCCVQQALPSSGTCAEQVDARHTVIVANTALSPMFNQCW